MWPRIVLEGPPALQTSWIHVFHFFVDYSILKKNFPFLSFSKRVKSKIMLDENPDGELLLSDFETPITETSEVNKSVDDAKIAWHQNGEIVHAISEELDSLCHLDLEPYGITAISIQGLDSQDTPFVLIVERRVENDSAILQFLNDRCKTTLQFLTVYFQPSIIRELRINIGTFTREELHL